jgi:hypothetical protein
MAIFKSSNPEKAVQRDIDAAAANRERLEAGWWEQTIYFRQTEVKYLLREQDTDDESAIAVTASARGNSRPPPVGRRDPKCDRQDPNSG